MTSERGLTIIETTVILSVMFVLAGVLTPIVSESVDTARLVKAANDAKLIAVGMIQFEQDLGLAAVGYGGGAYGAAPQAVGRGAGRQLAPQIVTPEILITEGQRPSVDDTGAALPPGNLSAQLRLQGLKNGAAAAPTGRRRWIEAPAGLIDEHLVTNRVGYQLKTPGEQTGWNGPYLSKTIKADPWGNRYQINSIGLDRGETAAGADGQPRKAVYVVSAGSNGIIETPFDQPIHDARLYGDDIGVRLQ